MASLPTTPVQLLDGGLGTSLEDKYGVRFTPQTTPLWSSHLLLSDAGRDTLLRCQRDFAAVPVDVLGTATYQVSAAGFAASPVPEPLGGGSGGGGNSSGIFDRARIGAYLEDAVRIAESAAASAPGGAKPKLALALGPYGACMLPQSAEYSGEYDTEHSGSGKLLQWHAGRLDLFAPVKDLARRVSYVAFETVPRLDEIVAIRRLITQKLTPLAAGEDQLKCWISCVYPGEGETLPSGSSPEHAVKAMLIREPTCAVPWGVGINCTKVGKLPGLVGRYEATVATMVEEGWLDDWPSLVLYPDGTNGEIYDPETREWKMPEGRSAPEVPWEVQLAEVVKSAATRGKWRSILVGGCCKTTDRDIKALRDILQKEGLLHHVRGAS